MTCERCEVEVPMLQQRFDLDLFRCVWVCMRCAPGLQPHDGLPVRGVESAELRALIGEIGMEAYRERRRLEARERRNERQRARRAEQLDKTGKK